MCRKKVHKIFMSLLVNTLIFSSVIGFKAYAQNLEGDFDSLLEQYKNENIVVENGLSLYVNDTIDLSQYSNWDILDTSIADIDENGLLVAKNDGTTYISQKIDDTVYIAEINVCNELISPYSSTKSSLDRSYYKVFLDPGHGGSDPGAIANGIYEDELNLSIAKKVQNLLKAQGVDVEMSRTSDVFLSLNERANLANAYNGDVFVSIHNNSFSSSSAYGIETFYTASKSTSKELANPLQSNMVSQTGGYNRGVKTADFVVTKNTSMPASLVEGGFLTNTNEAANLKTDAYQNKLAQGIANGIMEYLKSNVQLATPDNSTDTSITQTGKVTASSSLNVRSNASTSSPIIGSLKTNDIVEILETLNGWYKIKYNNSVGYVSSQYVYVTILTPDNGANDNNSSSDSNNGSNDNSSTTQNKIGKVTASSSLNVRSNASTSSSIIGSLKTNDTVEILETLNGWYKIKYNNSVGYVSSQYVSITTSAPNTGISSDSTTGSDSNNSSNDNSSTTQTKTGKVTASSSLNVRSSASTSSSIIGSLKTNDTVEILETLNGWYKIKYNNTIGYVSSQYISVSTSSGSSSNPETTQTKTGTVTASSSLNVRSSASVSSSIIGSLNSKATVEILETLNGWYKIKYNNSVGYVSSQYIKVN